MLTVIVDARTSAGKLPGLLGQLTTGAVEGLVKEVFLVAPHSEVVDALCEEMGAEAADSIEQALAWARSELVLAAEADFRLKDGWVEALSTHLANGGGAAMIEGLGESGLFGRKPYGVLVERGRVVRLDDPDLKRLRRELGLRPRRLG